VEGKLYDVSSRPAKLLLIGKDLVSASQLTSSDLYFLKDVVYKKNIYKATGCGPLLKIKMNPALKKIL